MILSMKKRIFFHQSFFEKSFLKKIKGKKTIKEIIKIKYNFISLMKSNENSLKLINSFILIPKYS